MKNRERLIKGVLTAMTSNPAEYKRCGLTPQKAVNVALMLEGQRRLTDTELEAIEVDMPVDPPFTISGGLDLTERNKENRNKVLASVIEVKKVQDAEPRQREIAVMPGVLSRVS